MTYELVYDRKAKKDLEKLDKTIQKNILNKLENLKDHLELKKKLSNILKDYYKLKSGKYRIIYFLENKKIFIVRIGHRKNIYDFKKKSLKENQNNLLKEKVVIVNHLDEILGEKERYLLNKNDFYRVSVLVIKNSKNQILLTKRKEESEKEALKWYPSVFGVNLKGDSYLDCVLEKAEDNLNLMIADFELGLVEKKLVENKNKKYFVSVFLIEVDDFDLKNIKYNKDYVFETKWFFESELKKELKESKYLDICKSFLKYY